MAALSLLLPLAVAALFDSPYIEHVDAEGYAAHTLDPDYFVVGIIYAQDTNDIAVLSDLFETALSKYHYFCKVIAIDCTDDPKVCPEEMRSQLPALAGYQPAGLDSSTGKPVVYKQEFEGMLGQKQLTDWLSNYAANFADDLDGYNIADFERQSFNKVMLFSNKSTAPLMFKGLSSLYRGRLIFGFVGKEQQELQEMYKVAAFPTLLVVGPDGVTLYQGELEFDEIAAFLEPFALAEKVPLVESLKRKSVEKGEGPVVLSLNAVALEEHLSVSQKLVLVHYTDGRAAKGWRNIKAKYNGIAELIELDCSKPKNMQLAETQGAKRLPSMRLFPINRKRKSLEVRLDDYFEETLSKELKPTIQPLDNNNIGIFISSMQNVHKIGVLLLSPETLTLQFKALASEPAYKEKMSFGYYSAGNEGILADFNLKRYPTIVAFVTVGNEGQMKTAEYLGELDNYHNIIRFIDQLFVSFKVQPVPPVAPWKDEEIQHYEALSFNQLCVKKGGVCLLAFLSGDLVRASQEDDSNHKHHETLQKLQAESHRQKALIRFGWIDGECQHELREGFGVPAASLPSVVLYYPETKL